jgi:hypothetical protein
MCADPADFNRGAFHERRSMRGSGTKVKISHTENKWAPVHQRHRGALSLRLSEECLVQTSHVMGSLSRVAGALQTPLICAECGLSSAQSRLAAALHLRLHRDLAVRRGQRLLPGGVMLLTQSGPTDMCPRTFLRKTGASERLRLQELISADACPPAARRRDHMIERRCLWSPRLITENPKVQHRQMLRQMSARVKLHSPARNRPYAR